MDVKFNNQSITPRYGKVVEVNALWLEALHVMASRCRGIDDDLADHYASEAQRVARGFAEAFWFAQGGYLYDCLTPDGPDKSLRPNQTHRPGHAALPAVHRPAALRPADRRGEPADAPGPAQPGALRTGAIAAITAEAGNRATGRTTRAPCGPG